jgi:hypothetical protein
MGSFSSICFLGAPPLVKRIHLREGAMMWPFTRFYRAEHASCFRAGSKEETREAV